MTEPYLKGNWKPCVLGDPSCCEMSIVHEDFAHGFRSFGWSGHNKIVIIHSYDLPKPIFDVAAKFVELAAKAFTLALNEGTLVMREPEKGYKIIKASPFEVGLTKDGKGIRTWWNTDFDCKLPDLTHPKIQEAIDRNESLP